MTDEERINHNLSLMKSMNAPQQYIDKYLASENGGLDEKTSQEIPIVQSASFLSTPRQETSQATTNQPLSEVDRIKHNVNLMQQQGISDFDIQKYLQSEYGAWSSGFRGAAQGATFNTSDEGVAAAKGVYDYLFGSGNFSDTYKKAVEEQRAANELAERANPGSYFAGEIAGGIAVPLGAEATAARLALRAPRAVEAVGQGLSKVGFGASKEAAKEGMLKRIGAGAKEGAAYGALYGAGGAEGGLEERATGAASGAAGGALVGGALPPVISGVTAPTKVLAKPFTKPFTAESETLNALGENLIKDLGPNFAKTPKEAVSRLMSRAKSLSKDPNAMLADIGGENTRRLMRQAQNVPNENVDVFKRKLNQRQDSQHRRLERSIKENLGEGQDFYNVHDKIIKERAAEADPAFKESYKQKWNVPVNSDFQKFLKRDYLDALFKEAQQNLENVEGRSVDQLSKWELVHAVKRQINTEILKLTTGKATPVRNWDRKQLTDLNQQFKDYIRKYNPKLGKTLDDYAEKSDLKDALEQGKDDILKLTSEEIKRELAGYSKAEADLYRLGAQQQLADKLIRKGQPQIDRTVRFADVDLQNKLKLLFPDQKSYRKFQRDLLIESKKNALKQAVQGGSRTDTNLITGAEVANPAEPIKATMNILTGNLPEVALGAMDKAHKASNRMSKRVSSKVLEMGTMHPSQVLPKLQKRIETPTPKEVVSKYVTPGLSGLAGPYTALYGGFGPKWEDPSSRE